jgi:predicted ester cyclase
MLSSVVETPRTVNGRRVQFTENVFYEFRARKITAVWSILDKPALEAQL